jgi:hypothetical protein
MTSGRHGFQKRRESCIGNTQSNGERCRWMQGNNKNVMMVKGQWKSEGVKKNGRMIMGENRDGRKYERLSERNRERVCE